MKLTKLLILFGLINLGLTNCTSKIENGFYISSSDSNSIRKTFSDYGDIVTSINPEPIIRMNQIISIEVDSNPIYDESIRLGLILSKVDSLKWDSAISNSLGDEMYFFIDDTLIDFQRIDGRNNKIEIWLSKSDHTANQIDKIIHQFQLK
jgi:hypothetical protein